MQGGKTTVDGVDFEIVDEKKAKCLTCGVMIYRLLQKAHATAHVNGMATKPTIQAIVENVKVQMKSSGIKKVALRNPEELQEIVRTEQLINASKSLNGTEKNGICGNEAEKNGICVNEKANSVNGIEKKGSSVSEVEKKVISVNGVQKKGIIVNEPEKKVISVSEGEKKGSSVNESERKGSRVNEVEKKGGTEEKKVIESRNDEGGMKIKQVPSLITSEKNTSNKTIGEKIIIGDKNTGSNKNTGEKFIIPEKNTGEKFIIPEKNTGEKFIIPSKNAGEKIIIPDKNAGEKIIIPDKNAGEKIIIPDKNTGDRSIGNKNSANKISADKVTEVVENVVTEVCLPVKKRPVENSGDVVMKKIKLSRLGDYIRKARECETRLIRLTWVYERFRKLRLLRGVKVWRTVKN
jgi:hypothetical protein